MTADHAAPGWGIRHAVAALLAGYLAAAVTVSMLFTVYDRDPTSGELAATLLVQGVVTVAAVAFVVRTRAGTGLADGVGLRFRASDGWGLPLAVGLQLGLTLLLVPLLDALGVDETPQAVGRLAEEARGATLALIAVSAVVVAPIAEELVFRGLLLRALLDRWGRWPAILGSAALFAAAHLIDPGAAVVVPALFLLGVVLGYAALERGDLGLVIVVHAVFNGTAVLGLLLT